MEGRDLIDGRETKECEPADGKGVRNAPIEPRDDGGTVVTDLSNVGAGIRRPASGEREKEQAETRYRSHGSRARRGRQRPEPCIMLVIVAAFESNDSFQAFNDRDQCDPDLQDNA